MGFARTTNRFLKLKSPPYPFDPSSIDQAWISTCLRFLQKRLQRCKTFDRGVSAKSRDARCPCLGSLRTGADSDHGLTIKNRRSTKNVIPKGITWISRARAGGGRPRACRCAWTYLGSIPHRTGPGPSGTATLFSKRSGDPASPVARRSLSMGFWGQARGLIGLPVELAWQLRHSRVGRVAAHSAAACGSPQVAHPDHARYRAGWPAQLARCHAGRHRSRG